MKDEPEIVKILREEEQLAKLSASAQSTYENVEVPAEPVVNEPDETTMRMRGDAESTINNVELRALKERYRIIFENYAVAITIADENEHIFSWNKYAEELLNMDEKDLFMRPVSSLYPPEEWEKIRKENVRRKGIKYRMETKMLRKNKKPVDVEISLSVLKGAEGRMVGSVGIIKDVTKLKKTEKDLKESEERYRTIFENSAVAITLSDENERIISWNKYAETLLDMKKDELYMKPVASLYPSEEWEKIRSENVRQKGMQHHLETKILRNDNTLVDVDVSLSVLKNHEGEVIGSIGVIKDITDQKQMEAALEESEKKFKQLYERAPVPYHTLSSSGEITNVNEKWRQILEYTQEEVIGRPIFDFISENEKKSAKISFEKKIQSGKPYTGGHERRYLTKDGEERIFVIHDFLSFDKNNNVESVHTIMEDVTERKQSEDKLKQSEKKYRTIFELSPEAIVLIDKNGVFLDANRRIYDWLGYKPEELIGKHLLESPFLPEESKGKVKKNFFQRMLGKKIPPYELKFISKSREKRVGMVYGNAIRDENKIIIGDLVVISDITKRKQVWDDVVKSEEKYRVLAETSADGVFTTDTLGRLTYVNPSLEKIFGRKKSQLLTTPFRNYLSDASVYLFQQMFLDVQKKGKTIKNVELEIVHSEGYAIPIEINVALLKKDKKFMGLECTVRDITDWKKIERELKKSEQLKTEFMNIAAHELKSPVTPIKGYLELIVSDKDTSKTVKEWARISLRNAERLLKLVNDILDVSRLDTDTMRFSMEKTDPAEIIDTAVEDMRLSIEDKNLKLVTDIPSNLPEILGDKNRLSQVLKNLLTNAIKFTDYGSITLRAEKQDHYLLIAVEDTGIGVSKDELKKIFSKFYQAYTGEDRKNEGAGLGLFICKEIIKKHKGDILVESTVGKGSTFIIQLPI